MRNPLGDRAGFSLLELLVAAASAILLMMGATLMFRVGTQSVLGATEEVDAQQGARIAIERMIQEVRGTGYDPTAVGTAYHFDPVANATATSITLQNDFNGNGVLDAAVGGCNASAVTELVGYRLVGTELRRSTDPPTYACEASIVAGVTSLQFSYLDADGNPTTVGANVRTVLISLTVQSQTPGWNRQVAMTDRVRLRNR